MRRTIGSRLPTAGELGLERSKDCVGIGRVAFGGPTIAEPSGATGSHARAASGANADVSAASAGDVLPLGYRDALPLPTCAACRQGKFGATGQPFREAR